MHITALRMTAIGVFLSFLTNDIRERRVFIVGHIRQVVAD